MRGIASLMVVFPHLSGLWIYTYNGHWRPWEYHVALIQTPLHLKDGGGHLGVVLFFLISGFIISHVAVKESRTEFLVKRVVRIFPPLMLACALMAGASAVATSLDLLPIIGNTATSVRDYLLSGTLLNYPIDRAPRALSLAWSLYAEILFYGLVALALPLMKSRPVASTVVLMLAVLGMILPAKADSLFFFHLHFTAYIPLFLIGRAFYLERTGQLAPYHAGMITVANLLIMFLAHDLRVPGSFFHGPAELVVNDLIGILVFYGVMIWPISRVPMIFKFFADISYSLYLVHLPVGMLILNLAHAHGVPFGLGFAGAVSASVGTAYLSHRFLEAPSQRLVRRWLPKGRARTVPTPESAGTS
ncbi:acyltransferase [Pararhodospirillum oryzae]|uniref:Acyltransferase n=2 Tax=Pararhodospirillum oryzae TaxID=478448 RepID=A0A512HC59_9PROT|nr:acyltransferase [Pararhodospirillum oryzae]